MKVLCHVILQSNLQHGATELFVEKRRYFQVRCIQCLTSYTHTNEASLEYELHEVAFLLVHFIWIQGTKFVLGGMLKCTSVSKHEVYRCNYEILDSFGLHAVLVVSEL